MERGLFFPAEAQGRPTTAGFTKPKDKPADEDMAGRLSRVWEVTVDIVSCSVISLAYFAAAMEVALIWAVQIYIDREVWTLKGTIWLTAAACFAWSFCKVAMLLKWFQTCCGRCSPYHSTFKGDTVQFQGAFATLARDGLANPTGPGLRRPGSSAATTHVCAPASNKLSPSGIMFVRKTQIDMTTLHCN
jgi:hypothetical protein